MSEVRVIGIGSPFGNDSIGWQVIEKLKQQHMLTTLLPERIDLIEADRPGINLIQMLQGARFVILVDAILDTSQHGAVVRVSTHQLINARNSLSSHGLDVASAIALADKLQVLPEKLLIIGLSVHNEKADPMDEGSIDKLTAAITCELEDYFAQAKPN